MKFCNYEHTWEKVANDLGLGSGSGQDLATIWQEKWRKTKFQINHYV